jgi:hypothetical protein
MDWSLLVAAVGVVAPIIVALVYYGSQAIFHAGQVEAKLEGVVQAVGAHRKENKSDHDRIEKTQAEDGAMLRDVKSQVDRGILPVAEERINRLEEKSR